MKIPAQKLIWFGVFKKVVMFGQPGRLLKAVVQDYRDAEAKIAEELKTDCFSKADDFMIEDIDLKVKAWEVK